VRTQLQLVAVVVVVVVVVAVVTDNSARKWNLAVELRKWFVTLSR